MPLLHSGDLENVAFLAMTVAPQTIATDTTVNGTAVDAGTTDDSLSLVYITGNAGDASTAIAIKIQESDASGGTYTDVADASASLAASATANDNLCGAISTRRRTKQYVRGVVTTSGGGVPSVPIACHFVGRKKITGTGEGYKN